MKKLTGCKKKLMTFFGITLPHWEQENYGGGTATITFVLKGRLISKKNNQMAIVSHKEAEKWLNNRLQTAKKLTYADIKTGLRMCKSVFIGNKLYSECKKKFVPVLEAQKKVWEERLADKGVKFPLKKATLTTRFYFKDGYRTDTINKQETVQDLLVEAGVIADDDYKTLNPIHAESGLYKNKITENIALVRLSCHIPNKKTTRRKITITDTLK
jgi:hypothetical protein